MIKIENTNIFGFGNVINFIRNYNSNIDFFDIELLKKSIKADKKNKQLLRLIHVQADITASLLWWNKFNSYNKNLLSTVIQIIPSNYKYRTIDTNYENLLSIYEDRNNNKTNEWEEFYKWIESLPHMTELINF